MNNDEQNLTQTAFIHKRRLISRFNGMKWGVLLAEFDGDLDKCPPTNSALIGNSLAEFAAGAAVGMELALAEKLRREGAA